MHAYFSISQDSGNDILSRSPVIWATNHLGDRQVSDTFWSTGRQK